MLSVAEAHERIQAALRPPAVEEVPLLEACGRVLAEAIAAPFPLPPFTNAAMDGFAVRAADLAGAAPDHPVRLEVIAAAAAGEAGGAAVRPGTCVQVNTGAPLPEGADAVVPVERTGGYNTPAIEVRQPVTPGENVRRAGEEVEAGKPLLEPGLLLGPPEVAVAAAAGRARVRVYRRPRVAVVTTGDELVEPGSPLPPGKIYNSSLYGLASLVVCSGGEVAARATLPDDPEGLRGALGRFLREADVVVTSGGVSMGRRDYLREVFCRRLGCEELFWRVAQKPGKPLFCARHGETLIFGLPGNPVSSLVTFLEYVRPTLYRLQGAQPPGKVEAGLAVPFPRDSRRHRFVFGRVWAEGGRLAAAPAHRLGSHMVTAAAAANALLEAPPGETPLGPGDTVRAQFLPWRPGDVERRSA